MKKINNIFTGIILSFFFTALMGVSTVFATSIDTSPTSGISSTDAATTSLNGVGTDVNSDTILPKVTTTEMSNRVSNKLFDIVRLLQNIAKPLSIFMFIVSAFFALLGMFSHGGFVMKGIWGMIIAICVYSAVVAAPEIVLQCSAWLMS